MNQTPAPDAAEAIVRELADALRTYGYESAASDIRDATAEGSASEFVADLRRRGVLRALPKDDCRTPRVWLDGDMVPAGTWVYVLDEDDPEEKVQQLDADEDCGNGNLGPLVEILLPDEESAVDLVTAEQIRRGRP